MTGNTPSVPIIEAYLKLKKDYTDLVESGSDPELQSLNEGQIWYLLTRMSDREIELLEKYSEDEKNWRESFIKANKDHYEVVEKQWREEWKKNGFIPYSERPAEERRKVISEGIGAAVQQHFSQKGIMGGILRQLGEVGKLVSKGICPMCQRKISSDQINQFQEGQQIKCESCGFSMQGGEDLTKLVEDLVLCHDEYDGYNRFRRTRASSLVKCQSTVLLRALR